MQPLEDGRVRVTFTRLASPYFVAAETGGAEEEGRDELLAALTDSREGGLTVALTWTLPHKTLALARP